MKYQPVERRTSLSQAEFLEEYARPGKPVILTGLTADWPAQQLWTMNFFRQRYGHLPVEVKREAQQGPASARMSLARYIDYLESTRDESPFYLASWDFLPVAPELARDFRLPDYWADDWMADLCEELRPRLLWLFIGPPRTGFRMHVDVGHTAAWNAQLVGSKRWTLFSPEQLPYLYSGLVNSFAPDLERFPQFARACGYECTLEAGEAIFTPSLWWHQTQILEPSIAVSGNYANAHNIQHVLEWLREREQYQTLAAALAEIAERRSVS